MMMMLNRSITGLILLVCVPVWSAIQPDSPPFALSLQQLQDWSEDSALADSRNISHVPLAPRFSAPLNSQRTSLDKQAKVLYAPDGMNNFANYLQPQTQFNLYNFTHWSQIDLLNWFAGTADKTVQIPARPWVDTAHKNGVKVLGSVFLAVARWGGSADTVETLLKQDAQGHFVMADKLIRLADYYGFDGWLMNQETDLTAIKDANNQLVEGQSDAERGKALAAKMLAFMQYLTANAPQGMEIHWYDSMIGSGKVVWQNELNAKNQDFLQMANTASSDGIFLNYWWNAEMINKSRQLAVELGRSPYDVYIGADLWPARNAQRAFSRYQWLDVLFDGNKALGSIALFAPNVNFNFDGESHTAAFSHFNTDPTDVRAFYATEQRLFNGNDLNLAVDDQQQWSGIGRYLPAKSVINQLPFVTYFNTGQGTKWLQQGKETGGAWTDMSRQDLLPTWQFAVEGSDEISVFYDFDRVYSGGSSLAIEGSLLTQSVQIPLYAMQLPIRQDSQLKIVSQQNFAGMALVLTTGDGQRHVFELPTTAAQSGWHQQPFSLAKLAGQVVTRIGIQLKSSTQQSVSVRIGQLELQ